MRSSFLYSVLAGLVLTSLGLSSADARHWHHYRHSTYWDAKPRYSSCICHFGYGVLGCHPAVSCLTEGGRCERSCPAQTKNDADEK